jgi:2-polyprenyl-3-methyl-5-hydroxy-6-metoxy-1,4-benzoquinol methylase
MLIFRKKKIEERVNSLIWYHTIDLGRGILTPGHYDLRPHLELFGLPEDLKGQTALDVGAASGFFSFEMEKRGAKVTATELPDWLEHDFGPNYSPDRPVEELQRYLHEPFDLAKRVLRSRVELVKINIYDLSPSILGRFDLVFCSNVLLHLTDPIRAIWRLRSVTKHTAIICTAIDKEGGSKPRALYFGEHGGTTWWLPNRVGFEKMVQTAGFESVEWLSEFQLDYRDGRPGHTCGIVRARKDRDKN